MAKGFGNTESRAPGERRPLGGKTYKRNKGRPFSTGAYTDPRNVYPTGELVFGTFRANNDITWRKTSDAGSYRSLDKDNAATNRFGDKAEWVKKPGDWKSLWMRQLVLRSNTPQRRRRAAAKRRAAYNMAYGPGASSSIPPVKKARIGLASTLGKRKG